MRLTNAIEPYKLIQGHVTSAKSTMQDTEIDGIKSADNLVTLFPAQQTRAKRAERADTYSSRKLIF